MKKMIALLSLIALTGCGPQYMGSEVRKTILDDVKPPRRMTVTVRDMMTDKQYTLAVAKRCSRWRESTRIGMIISVKFDRYRDADGRETFTPTSDGLRELFC
jgi:hypothetical protein